MLQFRILKAIFLLLLVFSVSSFAQIEEWVARYNGQENLSDVGYAITVDNQGNVYVAGYANYSHLRGHGDMLIIKYNSAGQEEWVRTYGAPGDTYDEARAIAVDNNGNVYVTGRCRGMMTTIKYNAQGEQKWAAIVEPSSIGLKIAIDSSGNVYVTGDEATIKYDSLGQRRWGGFGLGGVDIEFHNGYVYTTEFCCPYIRTVKYNASSGWMEFYALYLFPGDWVSIPQALAVDEKGNVYVTGNTQNFFDIDFLTIKYNSRGELEWVSKYDGGRNYWDWGVDVEVDGKGNIFVTGEIGYDIPPYDDWLTIKYDSAGNILWTATYNGPMNLYDSPYGIAIDNPGNAYVTGYSLVGDYCTVRYGLNGEEQWDARHDGSYPYDIVVDNEGNAYITGYDDVPNNNFSNFDCLTIKYSTYIWTRTRPMPEGLKKKKVKDGGSLVVVPDSLIFAFKGNKTNEFYTFDITNQTWSQKCSLPTVTAKKFVKKGAALTYGNGIIYATRGNNTLEFWSYFVNGDSWKRLKDVPLGSGKNLKGGTGLAYVSKGDSDLVYLLKGSKTNEFWVYYANQDTWLKRKDAPILPSKKYYKDGSCIVYDGNNTIYALKGGTNEFYAYDINTDVWIERQTLPLIGNSGKKKKVKNGGAMVFADSTIYAIKGGNTLEFWQYLPNSNTWVQKESLLAGEKRKRIKGGGALAYIGGKVYALKGNNTLEFWVYTPKSEGSGATAQFGSMAQSALGGLSKKLTNQINVYPNPFSKITNLTYTLTRPGLFSVDLFDISGRMLRSIKKETETTNGSIVLDFKELNSGVYFILFKFGDYKTTKKVILN